MRPGTGYIALVVLVVIGVVGLTEFLTGMTDIEMAEQQISKNPQMDHMWMIFGGFAAIAILWDYVPRWIETLRNTNLKRIIEFGALFSAMVVAISVTPMKDMDYSEQKLVMIGIAAIITAVYLIAAYIYTKKHPKKDAENPENPPNKDAIEDPEEK